MKPILILLLLTTFSFATPLRVATWETNLDFVAPTMPFTKENQTLVARTGADILHWVGLKRDLLQMTFQEFEGVANGLGYEHIFVPDEVENESPRISIVLSKIPFASTGSVSAQWGGGLMCPQPIVSVQSPASNVVVNMVGVYFDPVQDDFSATLRRFTSAYQLDMELARLQLKSSDPIVVLGSFNGFSDFSTDSILGQYMLNRERAFASPPEGDAVATTGLRSRPDGRYALLSDRLAELRTGSEVLNPRFDNNEGGLTKPGERLPLNRFEFSNRFQFLEHYPILIQLDLPATPVLGFDPGQAIPSVREGEILTVKVAFGEPLTRDTPVWVQFDDLLLEPVVDLQPGDPFLVVPAGQQSGEIQLRALEDSVLDGDQTFSLEVRTDLTSGSSVLVAVVDKDSEKVSLSKLGETVVEAFDGFLGREAPAAWTAENAGRWIGAVGVRSDSFLPSGLGFYGAFDSGLYASPRRAPVLRYNLQNNTGAVLNRLNVETRWSQLRGGGGLVPVTTRIVTQDTTQDLDTTVGGSDPSIDMQLNELEIADGEDFSLEFEFAKPAYPQVPFIQINEIKLSELSPGTGANRGFRSTVEVLSSPGYFDERSSVSLELYSRLGWNTTFGVTTRALDRTSLGAYRLDVYTAFARSRSVAVALLVDGQIVEVWATDESVDLPRNLPEGVKVTVVPSIRPDDATISLIAARENVGLDDPSWSEAPISSFKELNEGQTVDETEGLLPARVLHEVKVTPLEGGVVPASLNSLGQPLVEGFAGFDGKSPPRNWEGGAPLWQGEVDMEAVGEGLPRFFGAASTGGLYARPDGSSTLTYHARNNSGEVIKELRLRPDWELIVGEPALVPITTRLVYGENSRIIDRSISDGPATTISVPDIEIQPGQVFQLEFSFGARRLPNPPIALINEIVTGPISRNPNVFAEVVVSSNFDLDRNPLTIARYTAGGKLTGSAAIQHWSVPSRDSALRVGTAPLNPRRFTGAVALVSGDEVLDFLSTVGEVVVAEDGPAAGMTASTVPNSSSVNFHVARANLSKASPKFLDGDAPISWATLNPEQEIASAVGVLPGYVLKSLQVVAFNPDVMLFQDSDGDGMSDDDEERFGTDPNSASSVFQVGFTSTNTRAQRLINFETQPGRVYQIYSSTKLELPFEEWTLCSTHRASSPNESFEMPLDLDETRCFYRVMAVRDEE